ncbi:hypothetical protein G1C96_1113 [Bifidobacterium sp. DSM 109958]|uniref:Membrane iron-sulfur containing protein FtrD-like domain-containing protein n=1 Tax=Bifidobacterium moraviense TaxID=2675323 RepID=A0A7Y0HZ90_9BIFI|nr:Fe-S-containing protein [Bifidobacterium sp. DSM 109958]NMN00534.1 hypothetical protein [Bifidobacterium sp. DSM 109958]
MLGQYVQALPGMLAPCLLVMSMSVLLTVGEGRDKPVSVRWRLYGLLVGLAGACVFAGLRGTAVITRRSNVNLPALIGCVAFDVAMIAVVLLARRATRDWHARPARLHVANALSALGIAFTVFYATPDVILQLTNFVETGDSPFTSAMLLRALGFALGIGTAVVVAAIFRTLRTTAVRWAFTLSALLVVAIGLVRHLADLFSLMMSMRILVLHGTAFRMMIRVHNADRWLAIAQMLVFLIPVVASLVAGFRTKTKGAPELNDATLRLRKAFRRRAVAASVWSLVAMIGVTTMLTWGVAEVNKKPVLSPPEPYSLVDGTATITFAQVEDGHLHRFEYTAADGTVMRFIIIKKNGGAYGIGLDACETCGDAGYYEKDGKIICKRCDVAINLATIGFKGGCNPVPFNYKVANGQITIQTADLDALSAHFKK